MGAIVVWTAEQEEELKKWFFHRERKGYLSHGAIGVKLQRTRNAIIGKIHRMKLTRDPNIPCITIDGVVVNNPVVTKTIRKVKPVPRATPIRPPSPPPRAARPVVSVTPEAPTPLSIGILELNDFKCHYPVGEPELYLFCGVEIERGKTYCPHHRTICYIPPRKRDQERAASSISWFPKRSSVSL